MKIEDIIKFLTQQAENAEVTKDKIDGREVTLVNKIITTDSPEAILAQKNQNLTLLNNLLTQLNLSSNDLIDTHSTVNGSTLLHQTIVGNYHELTMVILNFGANPLIEDSNGDNAIILAAKRKCYITLEQFATMVQEDPTNIVNQHLHEVIQTHHDDNEPYHVVPTRRKSTHSEKRVEKIEVEMEAVQASTIPRHAKAYNAMPSLRYQLTSNDLVKVNEHIINEFKNGDKKLLAGIETEKNTFRQFKNLVAVISAEQKRISDHSSSDNMNLSIDRFDINLEKFHQSYKLLFAKYKGYFRIDKNHILHNAIPANLQELTVFLASFNIQNVVADSQTMDHALGLLTEDNQLDQVILPTDREAVAASMALLNDYSHFSFMHMKRHFRKDAKALIKPYLEDNKKINNTAEFLAFYQIIKAEYERISSLAHRKTFNNVFNSEYCRRLKFILAELESTTVVNKQNKKDYSIEVAMAFYTKNMTVEVPAVAEVVAKIKSHYANPENNYFALECYLKESNYYPEVMDQAIDLVLKDAFKQGQVDLALIIYAAKGLQISPEELLKAETPEQYQFVLDYIYKFRDPDPDLFLKEFYEDALKKKHYAAALSVLQKYILQFAPSQARTELTEELINAVRKLINDIDKSKNSSVNPYTFHAAANGNSSKFVDSISSKITAFIKLINYINTGEDKLSEDEKKVINLSEAQLLLDDSDQDIVPCEFQKVTMKRLII